MTITTSIGNIRSLLSSRAARETKPEHLSQTEGIAESGGGETDQPVTLIVTLLVTRY